MDIGDFALDQSSFEIRYDNAFTIWDRSGAVASELSRRLPKMELIDANPARVSFRLNRNSVLVYELAKAFVIVHEPKRSLDDLTSYALHLVSAVVSVLEPSGFNRVGCRLQFHKKYKTLAEATSAFLSFGLVSLPSDKQFGLDNPPHQSRFMTRWEGKAIGANLTIYSEEVKFSFTPPPEARQLEEVKEDIFRLVVDLDFFSTAIMLPEQLRVPDWIANVVHVANRDLKHFLGKK